MGMAVSQNHQIQAVQAIQAMYYFLMIVTARRHLLRVTTLAALTTTRSSTYNGSEAFI